MAKSTQWIKKVDGYLDELATETDMVRAGEMFQRHLDTMSQFWSYSRYNQILIMLQKPEASIVAGFKKWKQMGRYVRKGEKAIHILAPGFAKVETETEDEHVKQIRYFFPVSVFDITQTDGDELDLITSNVDGDDAWIYFDALARHCQETGTDVKFESMGYTRYGASSNGTVTIDEDRTWNTKFGTFVHEMAHELLHWDGDEKGKQREEIEAESVSYVVLRHYGIETAAPNYLAFHTPDRATLEASLDSISSTAKQIITAIESKMEKAQVA